MKTQRKRINCALMLLLAAPVLAGEAAPGEEVLLYDVDFGPPHIVGEPPLTGVGPPPRVTPTKIPIVATPPIVVDAFRALTDRPVRMAVEGDLHLSQLGFAVQNPDGFGICFPRYRLELTVLVAPLAPDDELTIVVDMPTIRWIKFLRSGEIRLSATGGPSVLIGHFDFNTPVSLEVLIDVVGQRWTVAIDGKEVYDDVVLNNGFATFRINLSDFQDHTALAAADDIRLYGMGPAADVNCDAVIDALDLTALLEGWGTCPGKPPEPCPGDLDLDGVINFRDLLLLLEEWL